MTDEQLVDQAWRLLRRVDPWDRRHYWAMDRTTWGRFVCLVHPRFRDVFRRDGPQPGDQLFGLPVVVSEEVVGLNLIAPAPRGTVAAMPGQYIPAHPQTEAIDREFGWQDAHVMTFADSDLR